MSSFALGLGALLLSLVSFLSGKVFSQSEKVLDQKRKAYETFLRECPGPNEAHSSVDIMSTEFQRVTGLLTLYASNDALQYSSEYFLKFVEAQEELQGVSITGHPKFVEVMTYYNRMVWAMRRDVMAWSIFAPAKTSRAYSQGVFGKEK
ncbi:hypothetical protein ANTHELSMS3_01946 [Antarctobacter heliothermus]|uniref:Uncharacterized protein n=1 Tax=Antarctobacter heliothermus TaxID=74033 RepID=A0A222E3V0_9RHOB|nr:hypothetical protein [Antarctobacter heliothermus]ASP20631.1 hypothetical protein ANTHELSMS3_01946 [Antarctobacter heliothermus]